MRWLEDVELSKFKAKFCAINIERCLAMAFYLYRNSAYSIIYSIIGLYKNHSNCPRTIAYNWLNKVMSRLQIIIENYFVIY